MIIKSDSIPDRSQLILKSEVRILIIFSVQEVKLEIRTLSRVGDLFLLRNGE